jgi:hypothetical protein
MKNQFRKVILVVAILALLVIKSSGQIDLGIKGGINVSYQLESGVSVSGDDLIVGLNAGGIVRYHINEWLALKSDISYIQKGRRQRNLSEGSRNLVPDRFNYIILPLKVEISTGERVGWIKAKIIFCSRPLLRFSYEC